MSSANKHTSFSCLGWITAIASLTLLPHTISRAYAAVQQQGVWVLLPQKCSPGIDLVYNNRDIVVSLRASGEMLINDDSFSESDLVSKTREIFETRSANHLFLVGDPGVPFSLIARTAAELKSEVPDLNIVLLTTHEAAVELCTTIFDPEHRPYTVLTPPPPPPDFAH